MNLAKAFVFAKGRDDLLIELHRHLVYLSNQPYSSELWRKPFPLAIHSIQLLLRFQKIGVMIEVTAETFPNPNLTDLSCW